MKKYKWLIIVLNLVILLVYFNFSVAKKETLLKDGKLILLSLAPVDPRSLMQGDYMSLRYSISEDFNEKYLPKRGYCVVKLDKNGVAVRQRFQKNTTPLKQGEYLIEYNSPDQWNVNIGAESFFFQEGQSEKYEKAKYGAVKVDDKGNSLLVGLYDENLKNIK
ncbi:GDYXXLXY domain-containing protein [Chryseobacterium sp. Ch-15]|uniref:GDYXXLXY domain-containing protein n=1 Tax=Chryseobacterium muglaense TaxID=2893752 RepID=A0A9Q3UX64_9FLAO|nr:GDYXXLXY domain-containing protein [Chryseobacterium muglaense]MBD3903523.1 GDYXXLXY domain-containing protein [Chryseobacterium muglaense]MCC9034595.1 GDYXXLXY domain-containing protein [Chryseobacterium muglaense]MCM2552858.1 GDYXXLXY domain-containing protein [Chryseobacterium muglaense]